MKKIKFINFIELFDKKVMFFSPKQGLAMINAFFWSPNDSVHSEMYTFPLTLRGCVREQVQL